VSDCFASENRPGISLSSPPLRTHARDIVKLVGGGGNTIYDRLCGRHGNGTPPAFPDRDDKRLHGRWTCPRARAPRDNNRVIVCCTSRGGAPFGFLGRRGRRQRRRVRTSSPARCSDNRGAEGSMTVSRTELVDSGLFSRRF